GNISAAQSLRLEGVCGINAVASAAASFSNAGTIALTSPVCGNLAELDDGTNTITNTGTLETSAGTGTGARTVVGNVANFGTLTVGQPLTLTGNLVNRGSAELDASTTMNRTSTAWSNKGALPLADG